MAPIGKQKKMKTGRFLDSDSKSKTIQQCSFRRSQEVLGNGGIDHLNILKRHQTKSLKSAMAEYQNKKQEIKYKKQSLLKKKTEINQAMNRYKQRKKEKNKKMYCKTLKGQPVMKNRIEMLLEKIQETIK